MSKSSTRLVIGTLLVSVFIAQFFVAQWWKGNEQGPRIAKSVVVVPKTPGQATSGARRAAAVAEVQPAVQPATVALRARGEDAEEPCAHDALDQLPPDLREKALELDRLYGARVPCRLKNDPDWLRQMLAQHEQAPPDEAPPPPTQDLPKNPYDELLANSARFDAEREAALQNAASADPADPYAALARRGSLAFPDAHANDEQPSSGTTQ